MTWVLLDLVIEFFSVTHFDRPALVEALNEMLAFSVVYAEALPALVHVVSQGSGLFRLDLSSPLEVSSNQLLVNHSFRGIAHFNYLLNLN